MNKTLQKIARDPRVEEVENYGMDEGRFFVHLKNGWRWTHDDPFRGEDNPQHSAIFESARIAAAALKSVKPY